MVNIIGSMAMIASLIVIFVGLIGQVRQNYKNKSTKGLSNYLVYSACLTYTLWCIYGWLRRDYFLGITQTFGAIVSYVLLFQVFAYKNN